MIDTSLLVGANAAAATQGPRHVEPASAQQFRELVGSAPAAEAEPAQAPHALELDIEKILLDHLPPANASMAEFAVGLLRAQVAVSKAAVGIELAAKTAQTLTQGVQTLTQRG